MKQCPVCGEPTKLTYCSLSCSNRGRVVKNEIKYNETPHRCLQCQMPIPYKKRHDNVYCSHSCAAKTNNEKRPRKEKIPKTREKYQHIKTSEQFELGKITHRDTIRRILIRIRGNKCEICNLPAMWCGKPLSLTVDHEDGNAGNNLPSNVRLLCPNCDRQTPTFAGRNRGRGRQSRGLPLH